MRRPSLPLAISILSLIIAMTGTAVAATGGNFILGRSNTADTTTALTNTGSSAPLTLTAKSGQPPLAVNSSVRVANLNASKVGGRTATQLGSRVYSHGRGGPGVGTEATDPSTRTPWGGRDSAGNPYFFIDFTKVDSSTCLVVNWFATNFVLGKTGSAYYHVAFRETGATSTSFAGHTSFFFNALSQHQTAGAVDHLYALPAGNYRAWLEVQPGVAGTRVVTDRNDRVTLMLMETGECSNI